LTDPVAIGFATQSRLPLESLCELTCKSENKENGTEVLRGSNFFHTFFSIPFIPLASPAVASYPLRIPVKTSVYLQPSFQASESFAGLSPSMA
jgi:hypothetical protein